MKHPSAKNLTADEVTKIKGAIKRILKKEGLSDIPVIVKPNVFSTEHSYSVTLNEYVSNQSLQFGGDLLTGSRYPARIYYLEYISGKYRLSSITRPRNLMLATVVSSAILEEIAHALTVRKNINSKSHGKEFYNELIKLWKKYFDTLHFQMIGIYGLEGDY